MAKLSDLKPTPKGVEIEVPFTIMRSIGHEVYEVVTGTIKGVPTTTKVIEPRVTFVPARDAAVKAVRAQCNVALKAFGSSLDV